MQDTRRTDRGTARPIQDQETACIIRPFGLSRILHPVSHIFSKKPDVAIQPTFQIWVCRWVLAPYGRISSRFRRHIEPRRLMPSGISSTGGLVRSCISINNEKDDGCICRYTPCGVRYVLRFTTHSIFRFGLARIGSICAPLGRVTGSARQTPISHSSAGFSNP